MAGRLALIAGRGRLPQILAERLRASGEDFALFCLQGQGAESGLAQGGAAPETFRLERLGSFLESLPVRGFSRACLAGAIHRPAIDPAQIDAATAPLVATLRQALASGDDAALRLVIALFERQGLMIEAAHQIAPDLLPPVGTPTRARPGRSHDADIARASAALALLGQGDLGQACVVAGGQVVGLEAAPGTDFLLQSLAGQPLARGGLLVKAAKPGQDLRADMPAIGPETAAAAARAGLAGIVLQAGHVLVLDRAETIAACDREGLFLWVRELP